MLLDENRALLETRLTYRDPGTDLISLARRLLPEAARLRERGGRTRRYQRRSSA